MQPMSHHDDLANAIETGHEEAVRRLLAEHPDLASSLEWTPPPLHCAVLWNQPRIAEILLEHGADIEQRDPDRQTTPLRYAVLYARPDLIWLLIARGADTGVITDGGMSALELAEAAAAGEFEQYEDLPSRDEYAEIVEILNTLNAG